MDLNALTALTPLDGRYRRSGDKLAPFFSEFGLIKYRVLVEVRWLKALAAEPAIAEVPPFSPATQVELDGVAAEFSLADAEAVKDFEKETNHDVKAVEYFLKDKLAGNPKSPGQRIHPLRLHLRGHQQPVPRAHAAGRAPGRPAARPSTGRRGEARRAGRGDLADLPMLARTHGQPASPTTLGKEMANVAYRLRRGIDQLPAVSPAWARSTAPWATTTPTCPPIRTTTGKPSPRRSWKGLGLTFNPYTIQIEPHDYMAELYDACARINTVLIDLDRDVWGYISLGYFKQKVKEGEVGSSTMPHKVNPIDFENSEGNLGLANALLRHLSEKLPISRWQRDLTDSTVLRNMGVALGYALLGYESLLRGLDKLEANPARLAEDLDHNWEVLAEPIQTVMRRYGLEKPYEQLKKLTRGQEGITRESLARFILDLAIPDDAKQRLLAMTPASYIGKGAELARRIGKN
jgi:adenylosuccinate lyase